MSPALTNLDYVLGDTTPIRATLVDEQTNDFANLTGALGAWFTIKASKDAADADALITKALGAGIAIPAPTSGYVDIYPTESEQSALVPDFVYYAWLKVQTAGGFKFSNAFTVTIRPAGWQPA